MSPSRPPASLGVVQGAKQTLAEIWCAEDKEHARAAATAFVAACGAKFAKAVAKITDDLGHLLAFYDCPAELRVHLRTTNLDAAA